jgi:hypothetical protein
MFKKAKSHLTKTAAALAVCIAFPVMGHAADTAAPAPSTPAVKPAADAEQFGSPLAPAKPPVQNPGVPVFETPPMPGFMLRKPEKPLTIEEMKQQADEAAEKARKARAAESKSSPGPGAGTPTPDTGPSLPGGNPGASGTSPLQQNM